MPGCSWSYKGPQSTVVTLHHLTHAGSARKKKGDKATSNLREERDWHLSPQLAQKEKHEATRNPRKGQKVSFRTTKHTEGAKRE